MNLFEKASERLGISEAEYGLAENSFPAISAFWKLYIKTKYGVDVPLDETDVPAFMRLLKEVRHMTGHGKRDNLVDLAGYAYCQDVLENPKKPTEADILVEKLLRKAAKADKISLDRRESV